MWSPEIVYDFSPSEIPGLGVYHGYDEIRAFFEEDWFGAFPFEDWEVVLDELVDHGDQVIATHHQRGLGAGSGAATELEQVLIVTLRDGAVVRVEVYGDPEKALKAVGLEE
jgi:ketosteroid isomerase-like protein